MKERTILFSAPMVNAILEGRKTQTRRAVKCDYTMAAANSYGCEPILDKKVSRLKDGSIGRKMIGAICGINSGPTLNECIEMFCPYGKPGDRLWVKETWYSPAMTDELLGYAADGDYPHGCTYRKRRSIFMPRAFSRITLEVTGVRVERLQEISEADAMAEGVESLESEAHCDRERFDHALCGNCGGLRLHNGFGTNYGVIFDIDCAQCDTHAKRYRWLWESINGPGSWDANPWVWVIEFKRVPQ